MSALYLKNGLEWTDAATLWVAVGGEWRVASDLWVKVTDGQGERWLPVNLANKQTITIAADATAIPVMDLARTRTGWNGTDPIDLTIIVAEGVVIRSE